MDIYSDVFNNIHEYVFEDKEYLKFLNGDEPLRNEYLLK